MKNQTESCDRCDHDPDAQLTLSEENELKSNVPIEISNCSASLCTYYITSVI